MERSFGIKARLDRGPCSKLQHGLEGQGTWNDVTRPVNRPRRASGFTILLQTFSDVGLVGFAGLPIRAGAVAVMSRVSTLPSGSISTSTSSITLASIDPVDHLLLEDLGRQRVGAPFLFDPCADPAHALAGSLGHRLDLDARGLPPRP